MTTNLVDDDGHDTESVSFDEACRRNGLEPQDIARCDECGQMFQPNARASWAFGYRHTAEGTVWICGVCSDRLMLEEWRQEGA